MFARASPTITITTKYSNTVWSWQHLLILIIYNHFKQRDGERAWCFRCMLGCNDSFFASSCMAPSTSPLSSWYDGWRHMIKSDTVACSCVFSLWSSVTPLSHPGSTQSCHRLQGSAAKNLGCVWSRERTPALFKPCLTHIYLHIHMKAHTASPTKSVKISVRIVLSHLDMSSSDSHSLKP